MGGKYAGHGKIDENWVDRFPSFASPFSTRGIFAESSRSPPSSFARFLRELGSWEACPWSSLLGPLVKSHGQLSSVHVEHVIKAVAHSSARLRLCGRTVGLVAQTVFRQNLSLREDLEGVFFNFRLFAKGLATLDRAVRSHTHHIIKKHAPNLTQDLASQPLLPLTPKRRGLWPSKKRPPYATMGRDTAQKKNGTLVSISPQHSGGWTGPPLIIISEMIVGWSGLPTPWTHFSNIDFPYPEIISAITDPHFEIISQGWGDVSMLKFQELNTQPPSPNWRRVGRESQIPSRSQWPSKNRPPGIRRSRLEHSSK